MEGTNIYITFRRRAGICIFSMFLSVNLSVDMSSSSYSFSMTWIVVGGLDSCGSSSVALLVFRKTI